MHIFRFRHFKSTHRGHIFRSISVLRYTILEAVFMCIPVEYKFAVRILVFQDTY